MLSQAFEGVGKRLDTHYQFGIERTDIVEEGSHLFTVFIHPIGHHT